MKYVLSFLLAFAILSTQAQETINGVTLPATLQVGENNLALNGGGIRKKLVFKLYTAGLYLQSKSKDADQIVRGDQPQGVRLVITSGVINSDNMSEAILEGFEKSTGGDTKGIQDKIDNLLNTFTKEAIEVGNIFDIKYVPGEGVKTYKNDVLKSTIPTLDFKQALFGIWLSENPVDSKLKNGLLGK